MTRALVLAALLAACNQREAPREERAKQEPAPPPPVREAVSSPDAAAIAAVAPPDAAPPDAATQPPKKPPADDVALGEDDAARYAAALIADDPGSGGGDLYARDRPGADLAKQIQDVRDSGKIVSIGGGAGRRTDGDPRVGIGDLGSDRSSDPKPPAGRITIAQKQAYDDTSLEVDRVLHGIQSKYFAGLKRCYTNRLKVDPTARGKLVFQFTVNESGRAVQPSVNGFDDEVTACVQALIGGWRFDVPKDQDGEATTASFQFTLQLVPD